MDKELDTTTLVARLKDYCEKYDIPLGNIVDVISDLKVIPMIRGKAFEFTAAQLLTNELTEEWTVKTPNINPQEGAHEADLIASRLNQAGRIRVECKLAKNDSFRLIGGHAQLRVKCMRSRTVGHDIVADRKASHYKISSAMIKAHADNYREDDFDFLLTSVGNSFWKTVGNTYTFSGTKKDFTKMRELFPERFTNYGNFQKDAFSMLLYAKSAELKVSRGNGIKCSRKACTNREDCGFIPHYPAVILDEVVGGNSPWKPMRGIGTDFSAFLPRPSAQSTLVSRSTP